MRVFKEAFSSLAPQLQGAASLAFTAIKSLTRQQQQAAQVSIELVQVGDRLFHMPFPTPEIIEPLSTKIRTELGSNFLIWNVSENKYDTTLFLDQVCDNCYPGYPIVPLNQLLLICTNIKKWLDSASSNVAIVHCKQNKSRSAILIAVYLYLDRKFEFVDEALIYVNKLLGVKAEETVFSSQRLLVRNVMGLFSGFQTDSRCLKVTRIMVNAAPDLVRKNSDGTSDIFKPCLEIWQKNQRVFQQQKEAESGESLRFQVNTIVRDDFLIWLKHSHSSNIRYSCLRVMLNTNFIAESYLRITDNDMDVTQNVYLPDNFFIDVYFQPEESQQRSGLQVVEQRVRQAFNLQAKSSAQQSKTIKKTEIKAQIEQIISRIAESSQMESKPEDFDIGHTQEQHTNEQASHKHIQKMIEECPDDPDSKSDEEQDIDDYISKLQQSG